MKAIKHIIDGKRCERELSPEAYKTLKQWNFERKWSPVMTIGILIEFLGDEGMQRLLLRHNGLPPVDRLCDELWELTWEVLEVAKEQGNLDEFLEPVW
jgi:hypothetical protein